MPSPIVELKVQHAAAISKADSVLRSAENAHRPLTRSELEAVDTATADARGLAEQITVAERRNALRAVSLPSMTTREAAPLGGFSAEYRKEFFAWIRTGVVGKAMSALYEGNVSDGGYAVPVSTASGQIVPLAPADSAVRKLATVISTVNDVHFPTKAALGAADLKAESGGSVNVFTGSDPVLGSIFLSAFMAGTANTISLELALDVTSFTAFLSQDVSMDLVTLEENLFVNGSGTGQAQGMIGNVGAGVTEEPDGAGNLISIDGTFDLIGSLRAAYAENATALMRRATAILIRKAQLQANVYSPVFTRENGVDLFHGYPVAYSDAMPVAARGACPILFGDFAFGYLIGDRGGPGVRIALLDQTLAALGQVQLLTYRRTDGRVRRSEAIQGYNIAIT